MESYSSDSDLDGSFSGTDATRINAKALDIGTSSNRLLGFTQILTSTSAGSTTSVVTTPISYSLDANGSMTSDGLRSFDYDESGRLAKVRVIQSGEAASVSYLTNGLGQRVFKGEPVAEQTLPNEATLGSGFIAWLQAKFRWMFEAAQASTSVGTAYGYADAGTLPSWALLGEYDNGSASGTGKTEYIWLPSPDGNAIPIGMRRNNQFYSIHADHLGTPRLVKDSANSTVWQWPYSAFGNNRPVGALSATATAGYTVTAGPSALRTTTPTVALNFRFPGQYADSETGEFYNYFRNYDPRTGRYPQADLIGLGGGWNRFGYVGSNPFGFFDPFGLIKIPGIPGADGETTVHANPGPDATTFRPDHGPDHVHLGGNDGPRVRTSDFHPLAEDDAKRMSRKQKKFCEALADSSKDKIRTAQRSIFKHGRIILSIGGGVTSIAAACRADPVWCAEQIEVGNLP